MNSEKKRYKNFPIVANGGFNRKSLKGTLKANMARYIQATLFIRL